MFVGSGTEVPRLQRMTAELGLGDYISFTGFLSGEPLLRTLSTFDIGIIPDPKNSYNDKISMNKLFEYMTLGIPFVQFDLVEGRRIAGDAALYAEDNSPVDMARQIGRLLDDGELREGLAETGRQRARTLLRWDAERSRLLGAYELALGEGKPAETPESGVAVGSR